MRKSEELLEKVSLASSCHQRIRRVGEQPMYVDCGSLCLLWKEKERSDRIYVLFLMNCRNYKQHTAEYLITFSYHQKKIGFW